MRTREAAHARDTQEAARGRSPGPRSNLGRGLAAVLFALLAGCSLGSFQRPSPAAVWFGLEPRLPEGGLQPEGATLQVLPFATAGPFRTDRLAARGAGDAWEFSHYHRWLAEPGEMVSAATARYLARCDLFRAVNSGGNVFEPEYRLGGSVRALYWDRPEGRLVLEADASLVRYPAEFLGFWVHRAEAAVPGNDLQGVPAAAASALERILSDLRSDLREALATAGSGGQAPGAPPERKE